MNGRSELRLHSAARPERAKTLRHALASFLCAIGIDAERSDDILTAAGEALANVMEHAYEQAGHSPESDVELVARTIGADGLCIDVYDRGRFLRQPQRAGRGFGLRIVRAIAQEVEVNASTDGTHVRMTFDTSAPFEPQWG